MNGMNGMIEYMVMTLFFWIGLASLGWKKGRDGM